MKIKLNNSKLKQNKKINFKKKEKWNTLKVLKIN